MHKDDVAEILIDARQLAERIAELGEQISADYAGLDPVLIAVLKGSVLFLADLMRHITVPHSIDFMATSSYEGTHSTGVVRILKDLDMSIENRNVLVVEDIIDTGYTLDYLLRVLHQRHPASLRICTLLNKGSRRQVDIPLDYVGFDIPDKFVIGYGLDYEELYRNLPFVGVLRPELYAK